MIGKTISHFKILQKLGSGGMGVVYKAEDITLKRLVALKFLPSTIAENSEEKIRFVREAQAAAALDHPNIAAVYEIEESEGEMFIVMAYVEGVNLKQKIKSGPLRVQESLDISTRIAQGLKEAHDKGVIHRDIKSTNVMVTPKGQVKITDFGLAKFKGEKTITKSGSQMGTASYMSPEQIEGESVDHRSDIFSLGVVLYEMLTGQLPFKGENDQAVMYSILYHTPQPVSELRPEVPLGLEQIVKKAIMKDKGQRYHQVDAMLVDLKRPIKELDTPCKMVDKKPSEKRFKRFSILLGIVLFLALIVILLKPLLFEQTVVSEPTPIAVISFENQTGDKAYDYLQKAIPNLLITNLEQSKYLSVTTWERMHDLLKQMGKEDVEIIDRNLGFELCRIDGINAIVLGSFIKAGDMFATDVKVLDVESKRILSSASSKGEGVGSILKTQIDELSKEISRGVGIANRKIDAIQQPIADVTTHSMDAYNYFIQGRDEFEKFYWKDAQRFLEKAIELDSTFASAHFWLGWTYKNLGKTKAMKETYEKARILSEKATEKEKLYIEVAYAFSIEGNIDKAIHILEQMAMRYSKEKRVHFFLGIYYRGTELFHEAIEEFDKALELDPNYGTAINELAYTYARMGNFEKSLEYFKRYASVSPNDANPLDSMADLYFRMGRLDESIAKYKEALIIEPNFSEVSTSIGYIYALKENYLEAMQWFDKYIDTASSPSMRAEGYVWKGFIKYWLGSWEQALGDLRRAADLTETEGNELWKACADWTTAWIYYDKTEFDLCRSYFRSWFDFVMEYYPASTPSNKANYSFQLALVDLKQGRIDSAKSRLAEMKSLLPEIAPARKNWITIRYNLLHGEVLLTENSVQKAISVCKKVSPLEIPSMYTRIILPYNAPFQKEILARAYHQNGELDKAIAEYERLITFDPSSKERYLIHPKYHYNLAKLYEEKGWPGKAIEQYEKFLEIWKDADEALAELADAKVRLAKLNHQLH